MNYPKPVGPYSVYTVAGNTIYFSGQIGLNPDSMTLEHGVIAQTRRVCENIKGVCRDAGISIHNICKTSIFLADITDFDRVNEVYAEYFPHTPARSCVAVKELPKGALVEIECIAVK